jgi:hypothetical protein
MLQTLVRSQVSPPKRRINSSLKKSVKSHVPRPVPLVSHWLKPVAWIEQHSCTLSPLHAYTLALICRFRLSVWMLKLTDRFRCVKSIGTNSRFEVVTFHGEGRKVGQ